ncbi:MAG: hypothetical protein DI537_05390 [Stutzerimonas stutzeri]|nr:MAG: hypothetical protein DI537_05390 [Stutzerimonas stutzeri]
MQYARKLALGAGAELISGALLSSVSLPTLGAAIAASTGLTTSFGFAGAALVWAVGGTMMRRSSPRLLSLATTGATSIAHTAGRTVGGLQRSMRIFSLLLAGDRSVSKIDSTPRRIAFKNNLGPAEAASKAAATGATSLVNIITTEEEYAAFKNGMSSKGLPIYDLDGAEAERRRNAKVGFEHSAEALAEITRIADQNERVTPEEAEDILDRLAKSPSLNHENRRDLLAYLAAQLVTYERETALERDRLDALRGQAEGFIRQIDTNIVERLKSNDALSRALHDAHIVSDVHETLERVRRSIETVGFDKTIELVRDDPARFGEVDRPRRFLEHASKSHALDNQYLRKQAEFVDGLQAYVANLKANSNEAEQARGLRELHARQSELDARVNERDRSLNQVKQRIERETLWIEPDVRRQILRESLETLLHTREPNIKTAEKVAVAEAKDAVASHIDQARASATVVDISALLGGKKDKGEEGRENVRATGGLSSVAPVEKILMTAAFKLDGVVKVPLYKREYELKMTTTAASENISSAPKEISSTKKQSAQRGYGGIER